MNLSPAATTQLARYDAARREDILRKATTAAAAENRSVSPLDIRLAAIPWRPTTAREIGRGWLGRPGDPLAPKALPASTAKSSATAPLPVALLSMPRLLKVKEVAAYLGISAEQVAQFRDGGELEFIDIRAQGTKKPSWRITRESVAASEQRRQIKTK